MFSSITCFRTIKRLGTNVKREKSARTCAEARDKFALCTRRAPAANRAAPRRGQGQERFVPTVQVKVRPGEVHNSWRPTWGQEALRRRRPRPSWSAPNESPTSQEALRRHRPRPSWSTLNESPTNQGRIEDLTRSSATASTRPSWSAPNESPTNRGRIEDLPSRVASASTTPVVVGSERNTD